MDNTVSGATHIRTPDQRLRVFVSSTLAELAPEREAVKAAVEQLRFIPVMFELGARPHPPKQLYRAYLEQSHIFVGVYWERYGWVAPGEDLSGLEDEFLLSGALPRLMYVKAPAPDREERLAEMLARLSETGEVSYRSFSTPQELADLVEADLAILVTERFESPSERVDTERPTAARPVPSLPLPPTPTVGRADDIDAIADRVASGARIVTITGPGGVGKTRVAIESARRIDCEGRPVRFVSLGSVADPALVLPAIADALGVTVERAEPVEDAIASRLAESPVLVVLDNFEQVVEAAGKVAALAERCSGTQFLITSRQVLHLRGEQEYPLAPLDLPPHDGRLDAVAASPAVALFVAEAQAARPAFDLTEMNVEAVAELVRRVDGLPLALELVAARIRLLTPSAMLGRLSDRLDFLTGGAADLPARQQTLRATLDWSHNLLAEDEKGLFARLGVFAGGADIDAVEDVCAGPPVDDVLGTLASLLEKSLVVTVDDAGQLPRIGMLHTVAAYAGEQLAARGELDELRRRHLRRYVALAESTDAPRVPGAFERWPLIDVDAANLRAAIGFAFETEDYDSLATLASSLWSWYWLRGRIAEGRAWIERLARDCPDDVAAMTRQRVLLALAATRFTAGEFERAAGCLDEARRLSIELDDQPGIAAAQLLTAILAPYGDDTEAAYEAAVAAEAHYRSAGMVWGLTYALSIRGFLEMVRGNLAAARVAQHESIATAGANEMGYLVAQGCWQMALIDMAEGDAGGAEQRLRTAAAYYLESRDLEGTSYTLEVEALVGVARDRPEDAARRFAAADALRARIGTRTWPSFQAQRDAVLGALRARLGDDEYERISDEGARADPFSLLTT